MTDKELLKKFGFREDFDFANRFDLKTEINNYLVSTVDLGLDHSFGIGKPLYYETMIFTKNGEDINFHELYCRRYSTEEEARKGHQATIDMVKEGRFGEQNE